MRIDQFGEAALSKAAEQPDTSTETPPACGYTPEVLEELGRLLRDTPPGEWGLLGLCPGPFGCPAPDAARALESGHRTDFCEGCRVIHAYRPAER